MQDPSSESLCKTMVEYTRYVEIAYGVAKQKPWYDRQMRGEGTAQNHRDFIASIGRAFTENNHSEATVSEARAFLEENIRPP